MGPVGVLRRRVVWVALALSTLAVDTTAVPPRQGTPSFASDAPVSVAVEQHAREETEEQAKARKDARDTALRAMFARRAAAVTKRDRAAFLADLDRADGEFVARQEQVFDSLGKLDFASWEYRLRPEASYSVTTLPWQRYGRPDDVALPVLTLHYQLKGYDKRPVIRRIVYTVVRRGDRWLIANDRDLEESTSSGTSVRRDPWENGPITVAKSANGLVIGHPADADAIAGIQREVESAVKHVSSFLGRAWGEKTVVILPADHEELQFILGNPQVPYEFAAIADPEFTSLNEDALGLFAGSRVVINPDNFVPSAPFNRRLIRHELAHVATFERTGPLSPKWLVEGIAEWVGNAGAGITARELASSLAKLVDEEGVPPYLPLDSDFGIIGEAGVGYDSAWLLCRYIASRWGRETFLRFYDQMGTRAGLDKPGEKLGDVLRSVLDTDEKALLAGWRPYVHAHVSDMEDLLAAPPGYDELDVGATDTATIARQHEIREADLTRHGIERTGIGVWTRGGAASPSKVVFAVAVVTQDEKGAAAIPALLPTRYRRLDSGRPIPHGRLYLVSTEYKGRRYNTAVAVVRAGHVTFEIRVLHLGTADPSAEARRLAAAQYAAATSV